MNPPPHPSKRPKISASQHPKPHQTNEQGYDIRRDAYPHLSPQFWTSCLPTVPDIYQTTLITLSPSHDSIPQYSPIIMITRKALPIYPELKLFYDTHDIPVRLTPDQPLTLNFDQINIAIFFSQRMFQIAPNKPILLASLHTPYLLLPLTRTWTAGQPVEVDWNFANLAGKYHSVAPAPTEHGRPLYDGHIFLTDSEKDAIGLGPSGLQKEEVCIRDPSGEFSRGPFKIVATHPRASVDPAELPVKMVMPLTEVGPMDRAKLVEVKAEDKEVWEIEYFPGVEGMLGKQKWKEERKVLKGKPPKYKFPSHTSISILTLPLHCTALTLPYIFISLCTHLLSHELITLHLYDAFPKPPTLHAVSLVCTALSSPANVWAENYERLEFIGDSALKLLTTAYTYALPPQERAGYTVESVKKLTTLRGDLADNEPLRNSMERTEVVGYIRGFAVDGRKWLPMHARFGTLKGLQSKKSKVAEEAEKGKLDFKKSSGDYVGPSNYDDNGKVGEDGQPLGRKTIADVAEALIGAALVISGMPGAFQAAKCVGVWMPKLKKWEDLEQFPLPDAKPTTFGRDEDREVVRRLLGLKAGLGDGLVDTVLNEVGERDFVGARLVYLGDAVLDFCVGEWIWQQNDKLDPQELSEWKSSLAEKTVLAALVIDLGLHKHLYLQPKSAHQVGAYEYDLRELRRSEPDNRQPWKDLPEVECLSNVPKIILALSLLISDWDISRSREVFHRLYDRHIHDYASSYEGLARTPRQLLDKFLELRGCANGASITFFKENQWGKPPGCVVKWHDKLIARKNHKNDLTARRYAYGAALEYLKAMPEGEFLKGCTCKRKATQPGGGEVKGKGGKRKAGEMDD